VLIGTVSIDKSERLSHMLKMKGINHQVLNAKEHTGEANIIAQAGEPGAVTVATNMAGRGVDIVLGGNEPENGDNPQWHQWHLKHKKVIELGGLHVVGTERHESRRIDNQLRGRAGRQGDPGSSRFYVSLGDDIIRRFGGDRIRSVMDWAGFDENTPIENKIVNRTIEGAQTRVEGYHFDMRKHIVEYDDVINMQREVIYGERFKIISGTDLKGNILSLVSNEIKNSVATNLSDDDDEQALNNLLADIATIFPISPEINTETLSKIKPREVSDKLIEYATRLYNKREEEIEPDKMRLLERVVMLRVIDSLWVEHLTALDYMRQGIGLQAVAQQNPLVAYKRKSHEMFQELMMAIQHSVAHTIYRMGIKRGIPPRQKPTATFASTGEAIRTVKATSKKVGRNDPCPCGSGKKFKKCCGK
jgi:preprotein translocase subunit SecA